MEYFISGKPRSYKKADQQCIQLGGSALNVSKVNEQFLDALQLRNIEGVFWVKDESGERK